MQKAIGRSKGEQPKLIYILVKSNLSIMSNRRIVNFNQKGFTKNLLQIMKTKEQQNECCTDYIESIVVENSPTITLSGNGTEESPLQANAVGAIPPAFRTVSSNGPLLPTDQFVIVDTSGGNVTLSVTPATLGQSTIKIKKKGTDINSIILSMTSGSIYADSGAQSSYTFFGPGAAVELDTDGTNSYVL
jgi:hypothetical protein